MKALKPSSQKFLTCVIVKLEKYLSWKCQKVEKKVPWFFLLTQKWQNSSFLTKNDKIFFSQSKVAKYFFASKVAKYFFSQKRQKKLNLIFSWKIFFKALSHDLDIFQRPQLSEDRRLRRHWVCAFGSCKTLVTSTETQWLQPYLQTSRPRHWSFILEQMQ